MSYDINLKHLEYFIKVARLGSINKAAQMLYVFPVPSWKDHS
ncbi:helix-turn-helix domain-containing protein [Pilosibacter fragilis]